MQHRRGTRVALIALALLGTAVGCGAEGSSKEAAPTTAPEATTTEAGPDATTSTEVPVDEAPTTDPDEGRGDVIPDEPEVPASGPTEDLTTVSDPVNNAFSIGVPTGWDSLVYSSVEGTVTHEVTNTVSPDGKTILFIGDPKIPSYWNPATAHEVTVDFCNKLDFMDLRSPETAAEYMPGYIEGKFGALPGFEITEVIPDPEAESRLVQSFIDSGTTPPEVGIVDVHFGYRTEAGEQVSALIIGTSMNQGDFWSISVLGLSTTGSTDDYRPMLAAMTHTQQSNPDWTAQQNARHEQVLAQIDANTAAMTSQHQANMAAIQSSAQRHQQRMEGIWAANDASVAGFYDRMATGDAVQQGFLNYINEENTVAGSGGQTWQVDNSYDRYWVDPATGSYVGGDINFGETQIRELGLDPSAYEEVQVVR